LVRGQHRAEQSLACIARSIVLQALLEAHPSCHGYMSMQAVIRHLMARVRFPAGHDVAAIARLAIDMCSPLLTLLEIGDGGEQLVVLRLSAGASSRSTPAAWSSRSTDYTLD
jgi:hypothetical protein